MAKSNSEVRLIASVALLLVPIALLGWLFVSQSNKDIAFAKKEIDGVRYLKSLMPIYSSLASGEKKIPEEHLQAFHNARAKYDEAMGSAEKSGQLDSLLAMTGVRSSSVLSVTRGLVSRIGDNSNLILDPDLDTYYLMDIAVLRIPDINLQTDRMQSLLEESAQKPASWSGHQQIYNYVGYLRLQHENIVQSLQKIYEHTSEDDLRQRLKKAIEPIIDETTNLTFEIASSALLGTAPPKSFEAYRKSLAKSHSAIWLITSDGLERLLTKRVERLERRLFLASGATALVTVLALLLALSVLRRLVGRLDDHIVFLAHHDPMTRLKNRASFTSEMEAALMQAGRSGEQLALHIVDCDNFKHINDTYGHPAGDAVLQHLAQCLLRHTRPQDIVGRLGGDEFVILQRNLASPEDAAFPAERIVTAMREPLKFKDQLIKTGVSIGNAAFPFHARNSESLMQFADASLLAAKEAGRNRAITFSHALEAEMGKQRDLEREVSTALLEDRLFLNFQPQFSADGCDLIGFEALLRLRDAGQNIIAPNVFIPVAENLGLINDIGIWVLNKATQVAVLWPEHLSLAVNLSPLQFKPGNIAATIDAALKSSGLAPQRLEVEITENIVLDDSSTTRGQLDAIRALGVSIVMDDFGTGFSSLSYLWRFRFDKIKIDRSFMKALDNDRDSAENILRSIVSLGHSLAMKVVAEGVETDQQALLINTIKCDEVQGFLYGRPMAEQDVASLILNKFREQLPTNTDVVAAETMANG